MDNSTETLSSPEWLHSARHVVWLDTDLLTGDGVIETIAPDCFTYAADGMEYVRFGKVRSMHGGSEARLPVPEPLLPNVLEAAREHPGECVFLESLPQDQTSEQAWKEFFTQAVQEVQQQLLFIRESLLSPSSSTDDWLRANILQDMNLREDKLMQACHYVDSLLDPGPEATTMRPTDFDAFDVLQFLHLPGSDDFQRRMEIAITLRGLRSGDALYMRGEVGVLQELLSEAYSFFELPTA